MCTIVGTVFARDTSGRRGRGPNVRSSRIFLGPLSSSDNFEISDIETDDALLSKGMIGKRATLDVATAFSPSRLSFDARRRFFDIREGRTESYTTVRDIFLLIASGSPERGTMSKNLRFLKFFRRGA